MDATRTQIRRLALVSCHPEAFMREKCHHTTDAKRQLAMCERLIDYMLVIMYGSSHKPTFFLRRNWYFQLSTGTIIPTEAFLNFTKDNDTLSQYLRRPTL